jgi:uncharacterized OsmC-like protein/fermentation-respiration switch protein FrsA (DUF1100 family)
MPSKKITFTGHSGDELAAIIDMPVGQTQATAIFAHCFTCSKDIPAARRISQRLAAMGIAVLRFDFTGLGKSMGDFANTNFSTNVADLILAGQYLADEMQAPSLLIGHSLGGAAVLRAAKDMPSVKAVATIGAPADPSHVVHNFGAALDEISDKGSAEVSLAGRPFTIRKSFVDDVNAQSLDACIGSLKRALLVLHSPIDDTVGIESAAQIFTAAKHPKSFVTLDNADHLLSNPTDGEYAADVIAAWSDRYLDLADPAPTPSAPEGIVRSSEVNADGFLQDINAGPHHHTLADEPASYGGSNLGMTPFGFLSAGLAACTSMTIRMYARRKKWPLEHVYVDVTHDKIHAESCDTCETQTGKVDQFVRSITLTGDLDADQRQRLLEIADKCPVHKTLKSEINIKTELA